MIQAALEKDRQERMRQELPNKIAKDFPDFESVVTKENVDYLRATKPHIAQSLAATKDPYAQAAAAYDFIKAYCPSAQVQDDRRRAEMNSQKPGTLGAAQTQSPLSQAKMMERGLTPELKDKLQKEMIQSMRSA
jgi:hypothetical protein